jgi:predicted amidohydrolase YtcJ
MQPAFDAVWGGPDGLYAGCFGPEVAAASNPFAWCVQAGVPLAFGSDSTVTPLDPWGTVHAAVHHRGGLGIDRRSALRAHTLGGRYAAGDDDVGPLRPGFRADFAVWDRDPLDEDVGLVPDRPRCLATVVRGATMHGALGSEPD